MLTLKHLGRTPEACTGMAGPRGTSRLSHALCQHPCAPKPSKSSTETSASIQGEGDEEGREGERGRRKEGLGRWWDRSLEPGPGSNTGCFFVCLFSFWPHCKACGILVLQSGIEPTPSAVAAQHLNHWTTRKVLEVAYITSALCQPLYQHLSATI